MEVRTPAGTIGIRGTAFGCVIEASTVCVLLEDPDGKVGEIEFCNAGGRRVVDQVYERLGARDALTPPPYARLGAGEARDLLLPGLERSTPIEPTTGPGLDGRTGGGADFAELDAAAGGVFQALGVLGPQNPTLSTPAVDTGTPYSAPPPEPARIELAAARETTLQQPELVPAARDFGTTVVLPPLVNGADLFAGPAFAHLGLALFGDPGALTVEQRLPHVDLTVIDAGAAFRSALGAYVIGVDGSILSPTVVTADTGLVPAGTSVRFDPTGLGLRPGETLGLFLLADGARVNPALGTAVDPVLAFRETVAGGLVPGAADAGDVGLELVLADGECSLPLVGELRHAAAHVAVLPLGDGTLGTRSLNRDDPGADLPRAADGGPITRHHPLGLAGLDRLCIAFEDSPLGAGDRDFQDLVIELAFPPAVAVAASQGAFRFAFAFESRDGTIAGLEVAIARGPTDARLVADGGRVLRFAADVPVPAERMAAIADDLALEGTAEPPASGAYALRLEASAPAGPPGHLLVRFVVPEAPLVGCAEANDELRGGRGADLVRLGVATPLDALGQPDGPDLFADFRAADGDLIDLAPFLEGIGFDPARADRFVRFVRDEPAGAVEIRIDPAGLGGAGGWQAAPIVAGTLDTGLVATRTLLEV